MTAPPNDAASLDPQAVVTERLTVLLDFSTVTAQDTRRFALTRRLVELTRALRQQHPKEPAHGPPS